MKKQISVLILSVLLICFQMSTYYAQVKTIKNGIELSTPKLNLKVQFYDENIVRIVKWSHNGTADKLSLSVIKNPFPKLGIKTEDTDDEILLSSSKLLLKIEKENGNIEYLTPDKNTILKEKGSPFFKPVVYFSDSGFTVQQDFQLSPDEGVYGLGEQEDGYFNYRNKKVELAQANVGASNSFLISTKKYGILWDNYSKTVFEDKPEGASFWSDMGNNIDYYFVYGDT